MNSNETLKAIKALYPFLVKGTEKGGFSFAPVKGKKHNIRVLMRLIQDYKPEDVIAKLGEGNKLAISNGKMDIIIYDKDLAVQIASVGDEVLISGWNITVLGVK